MSPAKNIEMLSLNGLTVRCAIAHTPAQHALGLQKHAKLALDEGLLFVFPHVKTAQFWMGEVPFAIDLIGIDADSRVSRIVEGAMPGSAERWSFPRVSAVLEVAAGVARRAKLKIGDEVIAQAENTTRTAQEDAVGSGADAAPTGDEESGFTFDEEHPEIGVNQDEMKVGEAFRVGRYGPVWQVVKVSDSGSAGYVQRLDHKRKWFGFSHNRGTGEIAIYPVAQNSGDRLGPPVAYGHFDVVNELGGEVPNSGSSANAGDANSAGAGVSSGSAQMLSTAASISYARRADSFNENSPQVQQIRNRETDKGVTEQYRDREMPDTKTQTSPGMLDEPKEQYYKELWGDELANQALEPDIESPVMRHGSNSHRVLFAPRTAQIVDEPKFVEKVARILFAHANDIQWTPDALNGGATERAVVARADLARWLGGTPQGNTGTFTGAARPEATQYIIDAAASERGMSLIGNSLVLADMADFTRIGFSGRQPILVLYREPRDDSSALA